MERNCIHELTVPNATWQLDKLAVFCVTQCRKTSLEVWTLGKALVAAKGKLHRGEWKPWLRKNCPGLSYPTLLRYKLFAERNPKRNNLRDRNITESFRETGITDLTTKRDERKEAVVAIEAAVLKLKALCKQRRLLQLVASIEEKLRVLLPKK